MIDRFITWLKAQVGSIYVWGAQGETVTEAFIRKRETDEANANRALNLYSKRKAEGKRDILAYDCSGLVIKFLLDNKLIDTDTTAQGIRKKCMTISKAVLQPGDFVFRKNGTKTYHIGVYIGKGKVIHARGRDYGVVEETLTQNGKDYWNAFGRYEKMTESEETKMGKILVTSPASKGDDVKQLQLALNALGYPCGTVDGIYGSKTLAAVQAFGKAHIKPDMPDEIKIVVNAGCGYNYYSGMIKREG